MLSFTPIHNAELEQGKLMAALGAKNTRNRLKFCKISRKDLFSVQKCKQWI